MAIYWLQASQQWVSTAAGNRNEVAATDSTLRLNCSTCYSECLACTGDAVEACRQPNVCSGPALQPYSVELRLLPQLNPQRKCLPGCLLQAKPQVQSQLAVQKYSTSLTGMIVLSHVRNASSCKSEHLCMFCNLILQTLPYSTQAAFGAGPVICRAVPVCRLAVKCQAEPSCFACKLGEVCFEMHSLKLRQGGTTFIHACIHARCAVLDQYYSHCGCRSAKIDWDSLGFGITHHAPVRPLFLAGTSGHAFVASTETATACLAGSMQTSKRCISGMSVGHAFASCISSLHGLFLGAF